jgi:hypothetical protein
VAHTPGGLLFGLYRQFLASLVAQLGVLAQCRLVQIVGSFAYDPIRNFQLEGLCQAIEKAPLHLASGPAILFLCEILADPFPELVDCIKLGHLLREGVGHLRQVAGLDLDQLELLVTLVAARLDDSRPSGQASLKFANPNIAPPSG